MADLDDAAGQALTRLKDLETELETAKTGMDDADAEVRRLATQLESDWSSFEDATESLLDKARSVKQALDTAGQQTNQVLGELQQQLATGYQDAAQEAQGAVEEVGAIEQQLQAATPDVAAKGDAFGAQGKALADHAAQLAGEMETTFQQVAHFLEQDVVSSLRQMKESVHDMAQKVRTEVFDAAIADMQGAQREFDAYLDDVDQSTSGSLEDMALHIPMVVEYAMKECQDAHEKHLGDMIEIAASLKTAMEKLEATIEAQEQAARTTSQTLQPECSETDQNATNAAQALNSVRDLLARYSFTN
jgi:DNA repair exonuclease SbcCD ATPase subunit